MDRKEIKAPAGEVKKRQFIFTFPRQVVYVKVLGADHPIEGLGERVRDDNGLELKRQEEAATRGIDARAYRPKGDTGFCLFQKEPGVRITNLVAELQALGLHYTGGFYQKVEGKNCPVQTFVFSTEGDALPIPPAVQALLDNRFGEVSVWLNPRNNRDSKGLHRVDTVNLTGPHLGKKGKPTRVLTIVGSTYRLVQSV